MHTAFALAILYLEIDFIRYINMCTKNTIICEYNCLKDYTSVFIRINENEGKIYRFSCG